MISTKSMKGLILGLNLLMAGLFLSSEGSATVVLTEDRVFGPNTIIRDVDNRRDFLRLDFTTPYTYAEIIYLTEIGFPGDFEGWRVASQAQLEELGVSAGITPASTDPGIIALATQLRDWLCVSCVRSTSTHVSARGLLRDSIIRQPDGVDEIVQVAFGIGERLNTEPHEAHFRTVGWGRDFWRGEEIFLVRDDAPAVPGSARFPLCGYGRYDPICWWYYQWEPGFFKPWLYGRFPYPPPYSYGGYYRPYHDGIPYPRPHSYGGYSRPAFGW